MSTVLAGISSQNEVRVVDSISSCTSVSDTVTDGNVVILSSDSGKTLEYLYIVTAEPTNNFRCDDAIKLYVNNVADAPLATGNIRATISAYADDVGDPISGVLYVAIYRNGLLEKLALYKRNIVGNTAFFTSNLSVTDIEGVSVKAVFWDGNMSPYVPMVELN